MEKVSADPRRESEIAKAICCTIGSGGDCGNPRRAAPLGANGSCLATDDETGSGPFDLVFSRDVRKLDFYMKFSNFKMLPGN